MLPKVTSAQIEASFMVSHPKDRSIKSPRFSVVSNSAGQHEMTSARPIVLALLVTDALRKAKLDRAVLEMRASPAGWVSFLTELDSMLREDAGG